MAGTDMSRLRRADKVRTDMSRLRSADMARSDVAGRIRTRPKGTLPAQAARVRRVGKDPRMVAAELRPHGPYSLRLSGRLGSDATRVVAGSTYRATIAAGRRLERVQAWQRVDGAIVIR